MKKLIVKNLIPGILFMSMLFGCANGTEVTPSPSVTIAPAKTAGVYIVSAENLQDVSVIDISIDYDPAYLSNPSITSGEFLANATMTYDTSQSGVIHLVGASTLTANNTSPVIKSSAKSVDLNTAAFNGKGQVAIITFATVAPDSGRMLGLKANVFTKSCTLITTHAIITGTSNETIPPGIITMKKGVIFKHLLHQDVLNDCAKCHLSAAGGIIEGFGKDYAHKNGCKGCHVEMNKGPTSCKKCHLQTGSKVVAASVSISPATSNSFVIQGDNLDNVAGVDMTISYDSSLSSPTVTQGSLISGALMATNINSPGIIKIAVITNKTFIGSGSIATLTFAKGTGVVKIVTVNIINSSGTSISGSIAADVSTTFTSTGITSTTSTTPGIPFSTPATTTTPSTQFYYDTIGQAHACQ